MRERLQSNSPSLFCIWYSYPRSFDTHGPPPLSGGDHPLFNKKSETFLTDANLEYSAKKIRIPCSDCLQRIFCDECNISLHTSRDYAWKVPAICSCPQQVSLQISHVKNVPRHLVFFFRFFFWFFFIIILLSVFSLLRKRNLCPYEEVCKLFSRFFYHFLK